MALAVAGCSTAPARNPVPEALVEQATLPGFGAIRAWGDAPANPAATRLQQQLAQMEAAGPQTSTTLYRILSLSGGGADGAFGAGLLVGWSKRGDRPPFQTVTGVSTGALIAPFAFLGSAYDAALEAAFTTTSTPDILRLRGWLRGLLSPSFGDAEPFTALISHYVTQDLLDAIAHEHARGRRLLIATTNLDAKRAMHWDIGAIAASGHPGALALVHQVILASASIPALFPPVLIDVEVAGVTYDEMHVDGGTVSQFLLYQPGFDLKAIEEHLGRKVTLQHYVIRNALQRTDWEPVTANLKSIASSSVRTLIRSQGIGDTFQLYANAVRDGSDFNLALIPDAFDRTPTEHFDPVYMRELFDLGRQLGREGFPWLKAPPGFIAPDDPAR